MRNVTCTFSVYISLSSAEPSPVMKPNADWSLSQFCLAQSKMSKRYLVTPEYTIHPYVGEYSFKIDPYLPGVTHEGHWNFC